MLKSYLLKHHIKILSDGKVLNKKQFKLFRKRFQATNLEYSTFVNERGVIKHKIRFVGIIINRKGQVLVSFPKHFINVYTLKNKYEKVKYIIKLVRLIIHYTTSKSYHLNNKGRVFSSYPFYSFRNIYKYYITYGLFKIKYNTSLKGMHGKILWNKIFHKSRKIISNNNLIFLPLFSNSKAIKINSFISNCMIYAINHTINLWKNLMNLPKKIDMSYYYVNKFYAINRLKYIELSTYKDSDLFLIKNLIAFFKRLTIGHKSKQYIKCYKFYIVWEYMVRKYLTDCFDSVKPMKDKNNHCLYLNFKSYTKSHPNKFLKENRYYNTLDDDLPKKYQLHFQPDHYLPYYKSNSNNAYIFDSKYYKDIDKTDYKQISYEFFLSNENKNANHIYNILFMPSEPGKHYNSFANPYFILKSNFNPLCRHVALYVCHLNSIKVTNHFINEDE